VRVLGIDTATWTASVGIIDGRHTLIDGSRAIDQGSHATTLLPMLDAALCAAGLRLSDLQLLAVSIGPGSFTGLRISLSVAKGLALASGLPLVGVPTLEAFAHAAGKRSGLVCPVLDARKKEVYGAAFRWSGDVLEQASELAVLSPQSFAERLSVPCTLMGDGVDAYESLWRARLGDAAVLVPLQDCAPRGASVAWLGRRLFESTGADDPARLEPIYLRKSEAELHRETHRRKDAFSGCGKIDRVGEVG
jgi:tRNA threonylcarbamoyladenosine biosynthesis protein TsaB